MTFSSTRKGAGSPRVWKAQRARQRLGYCQGPRCRDDTVVKQGAGLVRVSPDGRLIAVTGAKQTLIYEVRAADVSRAVANVQGRTFDVAWTSPEAFACVGTQAGQITVSKWNASTGTSLGAADLRPGPVSHGSGYGSPPTPPEHWPCRRGLKHSCSPVA